MAHPKALANQRNEIEAGILLIVAVSLRERKPVSDRLKARFGMRRDFEVGIALMAAYLAG